MDEKHGSTECIVVDKHDDVIKDSDDEFHKNGVYQPDNYPQLELPPRLPLMYVQ